MTNVISIDLHTADVSFVVNTEYPNMADIVVYRDGEFISSTPVSDAKDYNTPDMLAVIYRTLYLGSWNSDLQLTLDEAHTLRQEITKCAGASDWYGTGSASYSEINQGVEGGIALTREGGVPVSISLWLASETYGFSGRVDMDIRQGPVSFTQSCLNSESFCHVFERLTDIVMQTDIA